MKHSIAIGIVGTASILSAADAGISGFVAYSRNVGGNTVIDVFAVTTNASDKFLNVFDTVSNGVFVQKAGLSSRTWKPDFAGFSSARSVTDDSFMTAGAYSGGPYGGEYYASGTTNGDPNFTGTSWNATPASAAATTIPALAGWYTGDPTSVDNNAELMSTWAGSFARSNSFLVTAYGSYAAPTNSNAASRGIWVSHLVVNGTNKRIGIDFTWTAAVSIKDGVTGATTQASYRFNVPDTDGDGILDNVDQCPTQAGTIACNGCPQNVCGGCGAPPDGDSDGIPDCQDNCANVPNPDQRDCNGNGIGDACESFADCNGNGVPDSCDIAGGAADCNANGVPDSCELSANPSLDCDGNGTLDTCELAGRDCNGNGILDACELSQGAADCNGNGAIDSCDIASGASADLNLNGVPDECKPDCNGNNVPDEFEIADGRAQDCNGDGIPDDCQGARMVRLQSPNLGAPSGNAARVWNVPGLVPAESAVRLTVDLRGDLDGLTEWADVVLNGAPGRRIFEATGNDCPAVPDRAVIDLSRSEFNALLGADGVLSVRIECPASVDGSECKANGLTEIALAYVGIEASGDCNGNGRLDVCETADGTSPDCNSNDKPDSCDIADGTSPDCNGNGVPDSCEVIADASIDCNGNGIPDSCDLAAGGAAVDCDGSGRLDSCELLENPALDCNGNGRIDSCDISSGSSADIDANGRPDDCQVLDVPAGFPSIQDAIDAIPAGEMRIVRVQPGTYGPIDFKGKAARVISQDGPASTLICAGAGHFRSVVTAASGEPELALLEGFTVCGGRTGTQVPMMAGAWVGGGMLMSGTSMTVRGCVFDNNESVLGAGMYVTGSAGRVQSTTFRQCRAAAYGGGAYLAESSTVLSDCAFVECSAQAAGGGAHVFKGGASLEGCVFGNNTCYERGGGLSYDPFDAAPSRSLRVTASTFAGNLANAAGGGIYVYPWADAGALVLADSTVCDNLVRNVTGRYTATGSTSVCDCYGDCNFDAVVNGSDLARVLTGWGPSYDNDPADANLDGVINGFDLGVVLTNWGACPD
jgi:hypothetical protein